MNNMSFGFNDLLNSQEEFPELGDSVLNLIPGEADYFISEDSSECDYIQDCGTRYENAIAGSDKVNNALSILSQNSQPVMLDNSSAIQSIEAKLTKMSDDISTLKKIMETAVFVKRYVGPQKSNQQQQHECDECGKFYKSKSALRAHKISKHPTPEQLKKKPFCGICNISFSSESNRKAHEKMKHEGIRVTCSFCSQKFPRKDALAAHILRDHKKIKLFTCDVCNRGFTRKHNLKIHYSRHAGEMPFKCTKCPKEYTDRGSLNKHLKKIHMQITGKINQKELRCKYGKKSYVRQYYLDMHKESCKKKISKKKKSNKNSKKK